MEIRVLPRRGMSIRAIARELKMSRKTVRKYLRDPELEPVYRTRARRPSKLDPYQPYLTKRISDRAGCPRRCICANSKIWDTTAASRSSNAGWRISTRKSPPLRSSGSRRRLVGKRRWIGP